MAIVAAIIGIIAGMLVFIITWQLSHLFIPPRHNWVKSAFSVFLIKLGMALGAAFFAFAAVSNWILKIIK